MYYDLQGNALYYETKGEGFPVLFLHGWGGEINSFSPISDYFEKTNRCILVDLFGFGKSKNITKALTLDDYTKGVTGILDDMQIEKCAIIAHSFGCRISFKLLEKCPERFSSAVLIAPAGLKHKSLKVKLKEITFKAKRFLHERNIIKKGDFLKTSGSSDYRTLTPLMKKTFVSVVNEDLKKTIKKIKTPVLIVSGRGDTQVPEWQVRKINKYIPSSDRLALLGGHFCYLFEADRFCIKAESFVNTFSRI